MRLLVAIACLATESHGWIPSIHARKRGLRHWSPASSSPSLVSRPATVQPTELSLGAPRARPESHAYTTKGGIDVNVAVNGISDPEATVERMIDALDSRLGCLFTSSYEFPGRYARWTLGFVNPPLKLEGRGRDFTVTALNARGLVLLDAVEAALAAHEHVATLSRTTHSEEEEGKGGGGALAAELAGLNNKELRARAKGCGAGAADLDAAADSDDPRAALCAFIQAKAALADGGGGEGAGGGGGGGGGGGAGGLAAVTGTVALPAEGVFFPEEERSKQPSLFSIVRAVTDLFAYDDDPQLGLYGSFGYDLTFQFEAIDLKHERSKEQRDLVLYLPDQIIVVDTKKGDAWEMRYDFTYGGATTNWQARDGAPSPYTPHDPAAFAAQEQQGPLARRDTQPGAFSQKVDRAKEEFKVGNLFEAVLSQTFAEPSVQPPSELFRRLRTRNPAPYGFLLNLGNQEYLVGASPEMFVRCEKTPLGLRVETCPISGTIARGRDALEDAARVKAILGNPKEESELTMCTDVDRNDKSRICVPGTVRVVGRRQIEMYSKLIHTVDHVEGYLRIGFDALDAFLCHTWAVTVTGAPKTWAIQFVEDQEESPREWYGGAVGLVGFDGHLNTGLTLRTVHIKRGVARVRAGATLLFDSDPEAEERETELKASAMLDALTRDSDPCPTLDKEGAAGSNVVVSAGGGGGGDDTPPKVLLVDHEDSFVHTLANYLRQTGAEVVTTRSGAPAMRLLAAAERAMQEGEAEGGTEDGWVPDLVVLSPGPGNPTDFKLSDTLRRVQELNIPAFGVCLGLQGMVEYFGGELGVLAYPMHGKPSTVTLSPDYITGNCRWPVFAGLPQSFEVARYHSLHALPSKLPAELTATATTEDGVIMAIEHKTLPFAAVQFHPESILTNPSHGLAILSNCLSSLTYTDADGAQAAPASSAE